MSLKPLPFSFREAWLRDLRAIALSAWAKLAPSPYQDSPKAREGANQHRDREASAQRNHVPMIVLQEDVHAPSLGATDGK